MRNDIVSSLAKATWQVQIREEMEEPETVGTEIQDRKKPRQDHLVSAFTPL